LLNSGAFLAFMGVNGATLVHHFGKGRDRRWSFLVLPLAGMPVCFHIWIHPDGQAKSRAASGLRRASHMSSFARVLPR
jgi:hypothetical protein